MKVAVLVNATAGASGGLDAAGLQQVFHDHGISAQVRWVTESELAAALDQFLRSPVDAIVGGGGDGTLSTVAAKLSGTGIPLGILPLGTLNHFAKDLQVPLDLREAVHCIASGAPRQVDVGEVNGHLFINNSSIGAYPWIVEERERQRHQFGLPKWLGNVTAFLKVLRRWPLVHVKLEINGKTFWRATPFVFVGNNEYTFNPRRERLRNSVHAGELCIYMIRATKLWHIVRLFWMSLSDRLTEARDFESHFAPEATIWAFRKQMRVARDGEVSRLRTPLRYRIRPGELRVFCPVPREPVEPTPELDESNRAHLRPALRS